MSEDPPSSPAPRSWFGRLTHALSGEVSSREELIEELRLAQVNGLLSNDTLSMIEGAIKVTDLTVGDIMVPRSEMVSIAADSSLGSVLEIVIESGHSRFPVHGADRDEIVGILLAKDLLRCFAEKGSDDIRRLLRPVALIPEAKRLNILLKEFRLSHHHMAIVVDEYGGTSGVVTLEDVVEEIVGDVGDEHDRSETTGRRAVDGSWIVPGLWRPDEVRSRVGAAMPDGPAYETVGGFVMAALGRVPEVGDEIEVPGWRITVVDMDGRRVDRLRMVAQVSPDPGAVWGAVGTRHTGSGPEPA